MIMMNSAPEIYITTTDDNKLQLSHTPSPATYPAIRITYTVDWQTPNSTADMDLEGLRVQVRILASI